LARSYPFVGSVGRPIADSRGKRGRKKKGRKKFQKAGVGSLGEVALLKEFRRKKLDRLTMLLL